MPQHKYTPSDLDVHFRQLDEADKHTLITAGQQISNTLATMLAQQPELWFDPTDPLSIQRAKKHPAVLSTDGRSVYVVQGHLSLQPVPIRGSIVTQLWPAPTHILFMAARKGVDMSEAEIKNFALLTFVIATGLAEGTNRAAEAAAETAGLVQALGVRDDDGTVAYSFAYTIPTGGLSWVPKVVLPSEIT